MDQPAGTGATALHPAERVDAATLARAHGLTRGGARPTLPAYTAQLWARRHFVAALSGARLRTAYSDTRLGALWQVITPLVNAAVYFLVFGVLVDTGRGIENFVAYLCTGVFVFSFTQQAVQTGGRALADNVALVRAVRFPRASLPLAATLAQLQQYAVSLAVLAVIVLGTGEPVTRRWLALLPIVLLQAVFSAGLALVVARLAARTTDLVQLLPFLMRTWLYASGVFYSVAAVVERVPAAAGLLHANPMLVYIDLTRQALIASPGPAGPAHLWPLAVAWAVVVGGGGYVFFWHAEETYGSG
ncbi:MAG TPA: ABC transporter permease [Pilimelia sp.]|nr:ABC transporter permease [Pilimelia sp.]